MSITPSNALIPVGRLHHTLTDIQARVYDYDSLRILLRLLPTGTVFQPWEPQDQWRGLQVPITLGDTATEFGWGVTTLEGYFLTWDDFFTQCEAIDASNPAEAGPREVSLHPPTRYWKLADGRFLVEVSGYPLPTAAPVPLPFPGGDPMESAAQYCVVTASGQRDQTFPLPYSYSLEDVLYVIDLYRVSEGRLKKYLWQQQWGYSERIEAFEVDLPAIVAEVDPSDFPFDEAGICDASDSSSEEKPHFGAPSLLNVT